MIKASGFYSKMSKTPIGAMRTQIAGTHCHQRTKGGGFNTSAPSLCPARSNLKPSTKAPIKLAQFYLSLI